MQERWRSEVLRWVTLPGTQAGRATIAKVTEPQDTWQGRRREEEQGWRTENATEGWRRLEKEHKEKTEICSPEPGVPSRSSLFPLCIWKTLAPDYRGGLN